MEMLFDPFKEQLYLPATSIQVGNRECRQREIVAQEGHRGVGCWILEANAVQWRLEVFERVEPGEEDCLMVNDLPGRSTRCE